MYTIRTSLPLIATASLAVVSACAATPVITDATQAQRPPVITAFDYNPKTAAGRNDVITFTVAASDLQNRPLQTKWTATKGTLTSDTGLTVGWKPLKADGTLEPGLSTITVVVSNGEQSASANVNITIEADGKTLVQKPEIPSPPPLPAGGTQPTATNMGPTQPVVSREPVRPQEPGQPPETQRPADPASSAPQPCAGAGCNSPAAESPSPVPSPSPPPGEPDVGVPEPSPSVVTPSLVPSPYPSPSLSPSPSPLPNVPPICTYGYNLAWKFDDAGTMTPIAANGDGTFSYLRNLENGVNVNSCGSPLYTGTQVKFSVNSSGTLTIRPGGGVSLSDKLAGSVDLPTLLMALDTPTSAIGVAPGGEAVFAVRLGARRAAKVMVHNGFGEPTAVGYRLRGDVATYEW